jgi:hypothetical protein
VRSAGVSFREVRSSGSVAVVLVIAIAIGACAAQSDPAPTTITEAYRSAHPGGNLPEDLSTVAADLAGIARSLRQALPEEVPVILPAELPAGYGVAAPFVAVGSGAALPNPEVWERGYRVAFTDGSSLVTVAVNLDDPPDAEATTGTSLEVGGRRLQAGRDGQMEVVMTDAAADWQLTVIGLGSSSESLESFAAGLRIVP